MSNCPQCGKERPEGATYCSFCGALFAVEGAGFRPLQPPPAPALYELQTYLVHSILVTIFCCMPFGVVAIVFAAMATSAKSLGNYSEAARQARLAWTWVKVSFFIGLIPAAFWILYLIFGVIAVAFAAAG